MKWEDNIKDTLEKRTIEPSAASWNALSDRMDAVDKKKGKVFYLWMGAAASVVAILFTVTLFMKDATLKIQSPVLVDTEQQMDQSIQPMEKSAQEQLVKTDPPAENMEFFEKNTSKKQLEKNSNILTSPTQKSTSIAENKKEGSFKSLEITSPRESMEDKKVSEIVAQINDLKSRGQAVTDADIDALLHQAQKEIAFQSLFKEGTRIVDANALLKDVETDLQQSFRNKIFEALKNSYETVKTAVAERNH